MNTGETEDHSQYEEPTEPNTSIAARAVALDEARKRAESRNEELAEALEKSNSTIAERDAALDEAKKHVEAFQKEAGRLRHVLAEREEVIARRTAELRLIRQDLSRALNTVALQQDELVEQRARHAGLVDDRARLERLLEQLAPRLREAADHLRGISLEHSSSALADKSDMAKTRNSSKEASNRRTRGSRKESS